MKKVIMAAFCGLMVGATIAGDVYDLKLICKTPIIKQTRQGFYKDFKSTTYKGFVNIEYDADGAIVRPSDAILYGAFNEGKAIRNMEMDLSVLNVYGKKQNQAEVNADCDLTAITLTLVGTGKCKITTVNGCGPCGDPVDCPTTIRLDSIAGNLTGLITDVLCDPCNDNPWTLVFNSCVAELLDPGTVDVIYGSWRMKYNKTLSVKCETMGFPDCVEGKIPATYSVTE